MTLEWGTFDMDLAANLKLFNKIREDFGWVGGLYDFTYRAAHRLADVMVLKGIAMTPATINPSLLEDTSKYRFDFLTDEELYRFSKDEPTELPEDFITEAIARGDRCFGVVDGRRLASFTWYSNRPTDMSDDLQVSFDPRYVYTYKGYTHPDYRGQRLHGKGMAMACIAYDKMNYAGAVAYVEANNFSSLKSCYRLGYQDFGQIIVAKLADGYLIRSTDGCREYGFNVGLRPMTKRRVKLRLAA